jgi:hypothetical protein
MKKKESKEFVGVSRFEAKQGELQSYLCPLTEN